MIWIYDDLCSVSMPALRSIHVRRPLTWLMAMRVRPRLRTSNMRLLLAFWHGELRDGEPTGE